MIKENHTKPILSKSSKNGGYTVDSRGYLMVRKPSSDTNVMSFYRPEHRLIIEKHIGRHLTVSELVHHIDGDKQNNEIDNLQIVTKSEHATIHNKQDLKGSRRYNQAEVRELYSMGKSTRAIAEILGMGKSTVGNYIKELGISRPNITKRDSNGKFIGGHINEGDWI